MPRKPIKKKLKKQALSPAIKYYFESGDDVTPENEGHPEVLNMIFFEDERAEWEKYKVEILEQWILINPCSRPWGWWKWEAPKEAIPGCDFEAVAQRKRVGGMGTPSHEVLNVWGGFAFGIPESWVDQWQVDYYNGRAKDIYGNSIGTNYAEGHFKGLAIDPDNPPIFESEAAYLERHNLLTEAEKKYLAKHPEHLEPEKIE